MVHNRGRRLGGVILKILDDILYIVRVDCKGLCEEFMGGKKREVVL